MTINVQWDGHHVHYNLLCSSSWQPAPLPSTYYKSCETTEGQLLRCHPTLKTNKNSLVRKVVPWPTYTHMRKYLRVRVIPSSIHCWRLTAARLLLCIELYEERIVDLSHAEVFFLLSSASAYFRPPVSETWMTEKGRSLNGWRRS